MEGNNVELVGHTALVTGASQRLGAAIAGRLAQAGMRLAIHYHRSAAAAEQLCQQFIAAGSEAIVVQADLGDWQQTEQLLAHVHQQLGTVHVLINNAALFDPGGVDTTSQLVWQQQMAVNLQAPFILLQQFARQPGLRPQLNGSGGSDSTSQVYGKVINLLDRRVIRPRGGHLAYTISKSALWTLTRMAAAELAPHIQVNAIAPGAILPAPGASDEQFTRIAAAAPMLRAGTPTEIAESVLFMLQHDYITGELLCVDGGAHL
ncbi:MAG: SDR family oxidoreductase [Magnetococcales bacterium]|nr:SDR family oxidoreductase [Magnetococcales bacterium]